VFWGYVRCVTRNTHSPRHHHRRQCIMSSRMCAPCRGPRPRSHHPHRASRRHRGAAGRAAGSQHGRSRDKDKVQRCGWWWWGGVRMQGNTKLGLLAVPPSPSPSSPPRQRHRLRLTMDHAGHPPNDGQDDVDQQVPTAPRLQERCGGRCGALWWTRGRGGAPRPAVLREQRQRQPPTCSHRPAEGR